MKKYFSILFVGLIFISFSVKTDAQQNSSAATQNDSLFPKNIPALLLSRNGTVIKTKRTGKKYADLSWNNYLKMKFMVLYPVQMLK